MTWIWELALTHSQIPDNMAQPSGHQNAKLDLHYFVALVASATGIIFP